MKFAWFSITNIEVSLWRIYIALESDTENFAFLTSKNNILSWLIEIVKVLKAIVKVVHPSDNLFIELSIWSETKKFNGMNKLKFSYIIEIILRELSDSKKIWRSRTSSVFSLLIYLLSHLRLHLILTWWYLWMKRDLLMLIVWWSYHLRRLVAHEVSWVRVERHLIVTCESLRSCQIRHHFTIIVQDVKWRSILVFLVADS